MEGEPYDVTEVKREVMWLASNVLTYPFKEKEEYDYHKAILRWLAGEYDVPDRVCIAAPSFVLERKILDALFVKIWDKLTPEQRREILEEIDKNSTIKDKAGLAMATGATALTALSATVYFAGFAFYTTMSSVICATAGFFGITLPFGAYTGASGTAAVLSGPVGWAIAGLAALGSVIFLGRASEAKTAAFVTQIHLIKVQALQNSHRLEEVLRDLRLA
jgi:hypothetical protein